MFGFTKEESRAARFVADILEEQSAAAPETLLERNVRQLLLVERVRGNFDIDPVDALVVVARTFAAKYPH